ncbi:MAG: hypothetical protein HY553_03750 [Elusimicrobia bacterium]|nr:hypothetical protein [Elusimicrobiota bacterium]
MLHGVLLAAAALGQGSPCFQSSFPPVRPSRSESRREAIADCTRLLLAEPFDARLYWHRAAARWVGPDPARGWNEPPHFDLTVAEDPGPVIFDYEQALHRSNGERALEDPGTAWLRLGYLHASKGAWSDAVRAWRKAADFPGVAREARARLHFGQARLTAPDRLIQAPPARCVDLTFWDCAFVLGCVLVVEGSERAFRGCKGAPRGLEPGVRPRTLDCGLLDETFCEQTRRCRWRPAGRLRGGACVGAG